MPVEEIETTETIQKTRTEEIVICDSCGINSDSNDSHLYEFENKSMNSLYFCNECLDDGKTQPITENIYTPIENEKVSVDNVVVALATITVISIIGYDSYGAIGAVGVLFLYFAIWIVYGAVLKLVFN